MFGSERAGPGIPPAESLIGATLRRLAESSSLRSRASVFFRKSYIKCLAAVETSRDARGLAVRCLITVSWRQRTNKARRCMHVCVCVVGVLREVQTRPGARRRKTHCTRDLKSDPIRSSSRCNTLQETRTLAGRLNPPPLQSDETYWFRRRSTTWRSRRRRCGFNS